MAGWLGVIGTKVLPRCLAAQTRVSSGLASEVLTPSLWQRLVLASHRTAHTQASWSTWTKPTLCRTASQGPSILCQGQGQRLHALARLGRHSTPKDLTSLLRRHAYTDSKGYTHFDGGGTNRFGLSPMGRGVAIVVLAGGALYYYRSIETIPYSGRRHAIMFVSLAQERAMGKQVFAEQVLTAREAGTLLPPHHPYVRVVQRVGMTVAKTAAEGAGGGYNQHMKGLEWEFAVIQNPVPNAFVVPGGKVVVFSGLLDLLSSEAELAAVLAHETAHVVARHHAERISTLNAFALLKLLSYFLFGIGLPNSAMILGVFLPYSRLAEYEADEIGLILMAKACYDPAAAPSMLSKLHAKEQSLERLSLPTPAFLRTHPLTDARVVRVEEQLPQAYEVYQESGCGIVGGFLDSVKRSAPAWA